MISTIMSTNPISTYNPLVSVIIPVKNSSKTLSQCLRSIKRSYYKNYEIIVVDDRSTDNSIEIGKAYSCTVIQVKEGNGANNARNVGSSSAKGDILMFVDSDIVIGRETMLGIVESLEENHTDAVVGIYTAKHRNESFVSQYKNLWVRYS
ncbi:MAG: glycosyltransferase family 2 protein, partial [Bacteroidota bacterium]|nr:glycosyltransferase family 2 protein [Bacteroidota bacterium]